MVTNGLNKVLFMTCSFSIKRIVVFQKVHKCSFVEAEIMFVFWKQSFNLAFCVIFFFFIAYTVSKSIDKEKCILKGDLLQVHVLFRHGDRTPLTSYPVCKKYIFIVILLFNCFVV